MTEVSATPHERSRKAHSAVLRALQGDVKQAAIAVAMGTSESTVSRMKTNEMEMVIQFLYLAGFKVVPQEYKCIPEVQARAWFDSHQREVARMQETSNLWADE